MLTAGGFTPFDGQVVGRLEGLAGGRLLALGDEGGGLSVADLRMLGGAQLTRGNYMSASQLRH